MATFHDYQLLRVTTDKTDDADWAGGNPQTIPAATVQLEAPGIPSNGLGKPLKVEIVLEWLDASNVVVTSGGRGTFDVQAIRVMDRAQGGKYGVVGASSVVADPTVCIVDTAALTGQIAYRPVVVDEIMPGDRFTVRLTNMVNAGATKARVLWRTIY